MEFRRKASSEARDSKCHGLCPWVSTPFSPTLGVHSKRKNQKILTSGNGNLFTTGMGNLLTRTMGNVLTEALGKVLDIYNS